MRTIAALCAAFLMGTPAVQATDNRSDSFFQGGVVCSSLEAAISLGRLNISFDYAPAETQFLLSKFNIEGGRHCQLLFPTPVGEMQILGNYKDNGGDGTFDVYSFSAGGHRYFTLFRSKIPFA